jgi:hypothetical protein
MTIYFFPFFHFFHFLPFSELDDLKQGTARQTP